MSLKEREEFVTKKKEERDKIQKEIQDLSQKRKEYIAEKRREEAKSDQASTLDAAVIKAIRTQAEKKKFNLE